ncbi:hypothetical protein HK101_005250 [Irineochytrium annulatum]|nr:hypothetical protein HK101_005250 [Irineochytrium annulatum]
MRAKRQRHDDSEDSEQNVVTDSEYPSAVENSRSRGHWKSVYAERLLVERNWRRSNCKRQLFRGHTDGVMAVQFDDCFNLMVSGSYDQTIKVWNTETGECIKTLSGHSRCVRAVQFDEHKIISGSLDRTLRIWSMKTFECIRILEGHNDGVLCLHFNDQILASGSADSTIRVWNIATGKCFVLKGHADYVNKIEIYQKSMLFSCSDDQSIILWDLEKKQQMRRFHGHNDQVQALHVSIPHLRNPNRASDESRGSSAKLVTGSLDKTVKIWDIDTGECLKTLFGHEEGVWCVSSDTLRIVSGSNDHRVNVWDLENGEYMYSLTSGHSGPVTCCHMSDTKIATGGDDGNVIFWDFKHKDDVL